MSSIQEKVLNLSGLHKSVSKSRERSKSKSMNRGQNVHDKSLPQFSPERRPRGSQSKQRRLNSSAKSRGMDEYSSSSPDRPKRFNGSPERNFFPETQSKNYSLNLNMDFEAHNPDKSKAIEIYNSGLYGSRILQMPESAKNLMSQRDAVSQGLANQSHYLMMRNESFERKSVNQNLVSAQKIDDSQYLEMNRGSKASDSVQTASFHQLPSRHDLHGSKLEREFQIFNDDISFSAQKLNINSGRGPVESVTYKMGSKLTSINVLSGPGTGTVNTPSNQPQLPTSLEMQEDLLSNNSNPQFNQVQNISQSQEAEQPYQQNTGINKNLKSKIEEMRQIQQQNSLLEQVNQIENYNKNFDVNRIIGFNQNKKNLADSSTSSLSDNDEQSQEEDNLQNTEEIAPSIEQSYKKIPIKDDKKIEPPSFQNSKAFINELSNLQSPVSASSNNIVSPDNRTNGKSEKSMTIIHEEEFEESLQPNAIPMYKRAEFVNMKKHEKSKKMKLKKQVLIQNLLESQSEKSAMELTGSLSISTNQKQAHGVNSGAQSEEFLLQFFEQNNHKINGELSAQKEQPIGQGQFNTKETKEEDIKSSTLRNPLNVLSYQTEGGKSSQIGAIKTQSDNDSVYSDIKFMKETQVNHGSQNQVQQQQSDRNHITNMQNQDIRQIHQDLESFRESQQSEESNPEVQSKSAIQKMLEKYQGKYIQEMKTDQQVQAKQDIAYVKAQFPESDLNTVEQQSEADKLESVTESDFGDTLQSAKYVNRANAVNSGDIQQFKMPNTTESSSNPTEETQYLQSGTSGSLNFMNFLKTYGLEGTIPSLSSHISSASMKQSKGEQREQWVLISHKLAEHIQDQNNKIRKLESKVNSTKALWSNDVKQAQSLFQKQISGKEDTEKLLRQQITQTEKAHEQKLEQFRERLRTTEKSIYTQIESEYASLLREKDKQLVEQSQQFTQLQNVVKDMANKIETERQSMQEAHEVARDQDRQEMKKFKKKIDCEKLSEVTKEIGKLKEILAQEYQFKNKHMEETYQQMSTKMEERFQSDKDQFVDQKEAEVKALILSEKAKFQKEKTRSHAQATNEIYEEINKTLTEKFQVESRAKLQEITNKLKNSFQDKISQMENVQLNSLAKEKQKLSFQQLKNEQLLKQIQEAEEKMKQLQDKEKESKEKQQISFQLANNLQPKTGSDGNCKRCEALIFANGLYIEKIKKLKKKVSIFEKK